MGSLECTFFEQLSAFLEQEYVPEDVATDYCMPKLAAQEPAARCAPEDASSFAAYSEPGSTYTSYTSAPSDSQRSQQKTRRSLRSRIASAFSSAPTSIGSAARETAPENEAVFVREEADFAEAAEELAFDFETSGSALGNSTPEVSYEPTSLHDLFDQLDEPFSTTLLHIIDERGFTDAEVYKRANLSRQHFSKIRSDANYRPSKRTVFALAIALKLNLPDAEDLLERAGFAFSRSSKADLIVKYCIENGIHDIMQVNEALYAFDQPLL